MTTQMIASVLYLDRQAIQKLKVTDIYSLHRVVYSLYPDVRSEDEKRSSHRSGILYADQGGDVTTRKILLLANRAPAESVEGQHGQVISKPVPEYFLEHDTYRFKVLVNPTRRDSASRKLLPVKERDAVGRWFCERSPESWGFSPAAEHLQIDKVDVMRFKARQENTVTISQAHVQGLLRVTDRSLFQRSFRQGIGRARSFGCGLLQIVPINQNSQT